MQSAGPAFAECVICSLQRCLSACICGPVWVIFSSLLISLWWFQRGGGRAQPVWWCLTCLVLIFCASFWSSFRQCGCYLFVKNSLFGSRASFLRRSTCSLVISYFCFPPVTPSAPGWSVFSSKNGPVLLFLFFALTSN